MKLVIQTEARLASKLTILATEVKDLRGFFKKQEADLAVTKNVNTKLMERFRQTERQCWVMFNTQIERYCYIFVYHRQGFGRQSVQYVRRNSPNYQ